MALVWMSSANQYLKDEKVKYRANTATLAQETKRYKTSDSLNAVRVGILTLRIEEYKELRAKDLATINTLKIKNRKLTQISKVQTTTTAEISGSIRDSIVYRDKFITDTLQCLHYNDHWLQVDACIDHNGEFDGTITNTDSIYIVASVQYKRFLGFLWRTSKIKNKQVDVVSSNPHTVINSVEYVIID